MARWNLRGWTGSGDYGKYAGLPALETCRGLVRMVANLQQHRGLSSGWLAGDSSFEPRMKQRRQDIDALFPVLRSGFQREAEEDCPCFTLNDWRLFQFRWRELVEGLPQASSRDNVEGHTKLVDCVLNWLGALGESRIELSPDHRLDRGVVRNFALHLPALSECLGQARALGSSVAARGSCSPVAKVRLGYLVARGEALLERAEAADYGVAATPDARQSIRAMVAMVRRDLITGGGVNVSSEQYFNTATRAIDAVFAWIDGLGEAMGRELRGEGNRVGRWEIVRS